MRWENFVEHIRDVGFEGDGSNFGQVVLYLKRNKHDHEKVVNNDTGEEFDLKEMFDSRLGKPIDISKAAEDADIQQKISDGIESRFRDAEEIWGPGLRDVSKPNAKMGSHDHRSDVKWRKDRIVDDPKGGYPSTGHFLMDVMSAGSEQKHISEKLAIWQKASLGTSTTSQVAVGADGGFAAPIEMREAIEAQVMAEESILGRTRMIPISGQGITFPADETTQWGSTGVSANWESEAGTISQSKSKLEMKELKPRKVTVLTPVTEELLADAAALGAYVTRVAGERLDFKVGEALFRGTGAGQPLGFIGHSSTISVAKEGSQVADTVIGVNVLKMWQRLYGPWRTNAVWMVNQDVESELYRLTLLGRTGTGASTTNFGAFLYIPPGGMSGSPFGTLMGRPVIPTQHCSELGTVGDINLCAWDQYVTATRGGLESQTSIHLWFDQDAVAFKFRMRVDGQPWANSVISPRAGSNTMSAFITLASRA